MEHTRFLRAVDDLGRLCLPQDIRAHLGIREGAVVEIAACEGGAMLRLHTPCCVRCHAEEGLIEVCRGLALCRECVDALAAEK